MEAAAALIRRLHLSPHPEGGYYREIHRSRESVATRKGRRAALTTIFFLLERGQKSVFHRVASDEVWHYYAGAPLRLWRVSKDFASSRRLALGPPGRGRSPVEVIAAGEWQAAESSGDYTLTGCTVGPGFDFADFLLMRDDPAAGRKLRAAQPRLARFI
ncbi:MAG: cupin domain-containing protein [Fibrobacteres bacterium]|nr:cupin domain-containing protein [Fibrobacterota bacterium]